MTDKDFAIDNILEAFRGVLESASDEELQAIEESQENGDCVDFSFSITTESGVRVSGIWSVMNNRKIHL